MRQTARGPLVVCLLGVLLAVLVASCAATAVRSSFAGRVTLLAYSDEFRIELRSESHTSPVDFYSTRRSVADTKIASDEILQALVEYLDQTGCAEHAAKGPAPTSPPTGVTRALEIEVDGSVRHLLAGNAVPRESSATLHRLTRNVFDIFNKVQAFQQTDAEAGSDVFVGPATGGQPR